MCARNVSVKATGTQCHITFWEWYLQFLIEVTISEVGYSRDISKSTLVLFRLKKTLRTFFSRRAVSDSLELWNPHCWLPIAIMYSFHFSVTGEKLRMGLLCDVPYQHVPLHLIICIVLSMTKWMNRAISSTDIIRCLWFYISFCYV